MTMNADYAAGVAQKLMLALAESGSLPIVGNASNAQVDRAARRAKSDAEYLTTLYRDLVVGFQK